MTAAPASPTAARRGLAVAVLGAVCALGQAPLGLWFLTLLALAPVIWIVPRGRTRRARLWLGWLAGAGYFAMSLFWIVEPFMVDAARDGWMAPFGLVGLAGGMALFWAAAAALVPDAMSKRNRMAVFALGLVASDLVRSYILTGFPWALLGHVWIDTPVAQAAAFAGPIGLSGLTALLSLGLALGVGPLIAPAPPSRAAAGRQPAGAEVTAGARVGWLALLLTAAALAGHWAGGGWRLAGPDGAPPEKPVRVRLIQPNATQSLKWDPGMWDIFIGRMLDAAAAPAARPLDLVVWPETSVPYLLDDAQSLIDAAIAASGGVPLAFGVQRAEGSRYYNALAVTDATGAVVQIYDKHHLVPFGEYVPLGDLAQRIGVHAFAAQAGYGYSAGPGARVLDLGRAGKVLPLICYEAVFPQDIRAAPERADYILQVTNDSWFGNLAGPWQHLAQARLRAIETGLPLLRDANTGITAAFDAKGRPLGALPLNTEGFLDIEVPAALPPTPYARFGDWPAALLLIGGLSVLLVRGRR